MKKLIIFNLKMNAPDLSDWNGDIKSSSAELVVCPPFTHIDKMANLLKKTKIKLGSQDVFWENSGAYTGEISPVMLKNLDVEYVIIGHSERRQYLGETDEMIVKKTRAALKTGLKVVLCISDLNQLEKDFIENENLVIAYEPLWAIGTGNPCKPEDAVEMAKNIKKILNVKVLYGGSVNSQNIKDFLKYEEIDGVLIGGASLKKNEIKQICR